MPAADQTGLKRVLIIDDDSSVRELLSVILEKEGFQPDASADGDDALRKMASAHYDAVIADLMLPRFGGFEILRRLQEGDTANIPVLVITGRYTDPTTAEMIRRESNVAAFLEKPISSGILISSLQRVLNDRTTGA